MVKILIILFCIQFSMFSQENLEELKIENSLLLQLNKSKSYNIYLSRNDSAYSYKYINKYFTLDSNYLFCGVLQLSYLENNFVFSYDFILAEKEGNSYKLVNKEIISKYYWLTHIEKKKYNIQKNSEEENIQNNVFANYDYKLVENWADSVLSELNLVENGILNDLQLYKIISEYKRRKQTMEYLKYLIIKNDYSFNAYNNKRLIREIEPYVFEKTDKNLTPIEYSFVFKNYNIKIKYFLNYNKSTRYKITKKREIFANGKKIKDYTFVDSPRNKEYFERVHDYTAASYIEDIFNERLIIFSTACYTQNIGFRLNNVEIIDFKTKECYSFLIDLNDEELMRDYRFIFGY